MQDHLVHSELQEHSKPAKGSPFTYVSIRRVSKTEVRSHAQANRAMAFLVQALDPFQQHDHDAYYVLPLIKAWENNRAAYGL